MGLAETVTEIRYQYHLNAIEVNNVLNQLGLRKDDIAEKKARTHLNVLLTDIFPRKGYNVKGFFEERRKNGKENSN